MTNRRELFRNLVGAFVGFFMTRQASRRQRRQAVSEESQLTCYSHGNVTTVTYSADGTRIGPTETYAHYAAPVPGDCVVEGFGRRTTFIYDGSALGRDWKATS